MAGYCSGYSDRRFASASSAASASYGFGRKLSNHPHSAVGLRLVACMYRYFVSCLVVVEVDGKDPGKEW